MICDLINLVGVVDKSWRMRSTFRRAVVWPTWRRVVVRQNRARSSPFRYRKNVLNLKFNGITSESESRIIRIVNFKCPKTWRCIWGSISQVMQKGWNMITPFANLFKLPFSIKNKKTASELIMNLKNCCHLTTNCWH